MEIFNAHEHQAMSSHILEELLISRAPPPPKRKPPPEPEQALKCPRCNSANTKFCYYNNYSLSQPRHFCKGCRRYWTKGGSLRNIPVGGGCRKNRRSSSSPSSPPSLTSIIPPSKTHLNYDQKNFISYNHNIDLMNLALSRQLWPSLVDHEQFFLGTSNPNINGLETLKYEDNDKVLMNLHIPNGVDGGLGMEYSSCHDLVNRSLM